MSLSSLGNVAFQDACIPVPGKTEWGTDTLTRRMVGAASGLAAYIRTLAQGQTYIFGTLAPVFFLQTWQSDDQTPVATVTLNYKGLVNGTPPPDVQTQVVSAVGNSSNDFSAENSGLGRFYKKDVIWTLTSPAEVPGDFGITGKGYRDRYAVSATMDFAYKTVESTYRYITIGRLDVPQYSTVDSAYQPYIERATIVTGDGAKFGRTPWETFFELTPVQEVKVVSFSSHNIIGSPMYECEDVVRKILGDPTP